MSRIFGSIQQMGYIVADIDAELRRWTQGTGVGPFYRLPPMKFEHYSYKGVESLPELNVAIAYSGDMQVELIQPMTDAHSAYKDFLAHGGSGLQHVGIFTKNFAEDAARRAKLNLPVIQEGVISGIRFIFYGTDLYDGTMVEVCESQPQLEAVFDIVKTASIGWDGSDPVRQLALS